MRRLCTIFSLLFLIFVIFPNPALAVVKFSTDYRSYYRVDSNGITHVTFLIKQVNNLSLVYATDFGLNINGTKISNVKVTDENTTVNPEVIKTLNQTTISFPFANKVVGKDKTHSFIIEYDSADITTKYGNTWQINIPRMEADENTSDRSVYLTIPSDFPTPAYIDPKPDNVNGNVYYFSGKTLGNKAISAVFGQTQYFKGEIYYHLSNDTRKTVKTEIAIPPDTAYQSVFIESLEPKPLEISADEDGNYLATYELKPNTPINITLKIYFKLNFNPKPELLQSKDKYLTANSILNYENNVFSSPEIHKLNSPKAIYDYVVDKLKYDYEKVNRQKTQFTPAAESLINHQSAICTDFTNLFVALARKSGIPSRELEGYALSQNEDLMPLSLTNDVLHAWPEYYDSSRSTWIQIDPTWENTTRGIDFFNKLDLNHLVFVIHGTKPDYPIPAGGYKYNLEKSKDVIISPIENIGFPEPVFTFSSYKQNGNKISIAVINTTGVSYKGNTIASKNNFIKESEQQINTPPYGTSILNYTLINQPVIRPIKTKFIIYINGIPYEQQLTINPSIPKTILFPITGLFLASITYLARRLYLRRQKQKTIVYRQVDQFKNEDQTAL